MAPHSRRSFQRERRRRSIAAQDKACFLFFGKAAFNFFLDCHGFAIGLNVDAVIDKS